MPRMEDKIRRLCAQLLTKKNDEELIATLVELRDALHEHIECLRQRFAQYPLVVERRVRNSPPLANLASHKTAKGSDRKDRRIS
jgi:hypothetical protein